MKNQKIVSLALSVIASLAFSGCGSSDSGKIAENQPSDKQPAGKPTGDLEVAAFKGGYGIDFYQQAAKEFEAKNPGLKINLWGDPRVWEKLRPRFGNDTPPDLMFPGWGFDHWGAVEEDQIMALDQALDTPPYEGGGKWRDTFEPTLLALGQEGGKQYVLPYYFNVMGWWYDPGVFAKYGWTAPKTFDELLILCGKIKAKGIAPITYQGHYPYYMTEGMLIPWACSVGGIQAVTDAQNLVPGAWKSPAFLKAAQMIKQLQSEGFFEDGATAMTHTASQTEFLNGRAAMIPCGTWLYSEMQKVMPPGAKMQFMLPPVVAGGKGDPTALMIGIEPWMVPAKAKNPNAGIAFYKYLTSLTKAKQFVEQKGTLMAIKGSDQVNLPEVLKVPTQVFKDSKTVFADQFKYWYPAFETELENAITAMLNGDLTPEAFCDRVEAGAEKTRKDDSIKKHKIG